MSIKIDQGSGFKFIRGLNDDSTVVLAENTEKSETVVLREVSRENLNIYKRILDRPHENVEDVRKIIRVKNGYIAVCGFCNGTVLRDLMTEDAPLVKIGIVQISQQLCDAACHLYRLGLVHRDITPNNIIVDFGCLDKKLNIKLVDFDISRARYGGKAHDTSLFGTVGYAAPEQYGFEETDFRTDIYAAGRVIGDMLAVCGYPDELQNMWKCVIEKCTMYSPDDRYRSYEIMKKDIARIWQYNRALLMMELGHPARALKTILFGEKPRGDIEDDFLCV